MKNNSHCLLTPNLIFISCQSLIEGVVIIIVRISRFYKTESPAQDDIIETDITEIDTVTQTIFNRNKGEIIRLCADAIPIDIYGFQFELDQYGGPKIVKRSFQVTYIEPPTNDILKLKMLNCPRISYLDLETNQKQVFFDIFFLSQATDSSSAIVFKKAHVDRTLYPLHSITEISLEKLTELSGAATGVRTRFVPNQIWEVLEGPPIANKIITYQILKRSTDGEYVCTSIQKESSLSK